MIYRNIYKQLKQWASNREHKPLILRGARQVGKTTIVDEFSREFDNYIHLNLERPEDALLFSSSDSVSDIMQLLCCIKILKIMLKLKRITKKPYL